MYVNTITIYNLIYWLLIFTYWLLILNIVLHIFLKHRTVSSSIAWLLTIYISPSIGIVIYLLFGEFHFGKHRSQRIKKIYISIAHWIQSLKSHQNIFSTQNKKKIHPLFQLCKHRQGIGAITGNHIQLIKNFDETIIALIHDITLAQKSIDIIFYIWQSGGLVEQLTQALIQAAQRGVKCRILLDSAGSTNFFHSPYPDSLKKYGINIIKASDINISQFFIRRVDLRQHKKMILIDNHISYIGSMNMVDPRFFKQNIGIGQWIDIMVRINGPATLAMKVIFNCDWEIETGEHLLLPQIQHNKTVSPYKTITNYNLIQSIASGPGFPREIIHEVLLTSIYSARKKIIITTPYLIPSDNILYAICAAAQRGVKVHIIVPKNNDSILVNWASKAFFYQLLKAGVHIHQFQQGLLHTKSILIDEKLSLIGTANLDTRSIWLNFEIIVVIDDKNFTHDLSKLQKSYISYSQTINIKTWTQRPYWHRLIERLFYFFSPLL
ncbi:cardiolipin synthase [Blochmannia endosymbiont of Polyrhachis (Hedomyrma) turneri]|uniref:cardiolipin synthase n=1 Tax=Blochmannia endosymbiont of Polyrhachis (Hedomyrma) turneri TaxID=1505596 RepID=UPI00061A827C|nr:cardiolipin synthase [Blochmannia endosymbiont of Polyrhachis (Hedomyrma) turneri]AKC59993.1 cardiolipin synthase [Blochmannia endosymbiont of Polyrhachis (Hedomyrma) turneri]